MKPVGKQNQGVRSQNPKDFPALLLKILPAALVVAGLEACHNTSVSANTTLSQAPVVAPAGSVLRVRLDLTLDSRRSRPGDRFTGVLDTALMADGKEILPKGTIVSGHVLTAHSAAHADQALGKPAGRQEDRAVLSLVLDSCRLSDKELALSTDTVTRVNLSSGTRRRQRDWTLIGGGSGTGAPVGSSGTGLDGALGAVAYTPSAYGSAAGGANRDGGAAAQNNGGSNRDVFMPAESVVGFTLRSPLVV